VKKKKKRKKRSGAFIKYKKQRAQLLVRYSMFVILIFCALSIPGAKMQLRRAAREHTLVDLTRVEDLFRVQIWV